MVARHGDEAKKNLGRSGSSAGETAAGAGPPPIPGGEECWATVQGHRLRYLRGGSGPPLLLLHGLLGYSFSWRFNLSILTRHATCYAVDLLGTGYSERPAISDCRMRSMAQYLLEFMDQQGMGLADVLGSSHGGALAIMVAALANQSSSARVRRLVLVAPGNPWSAHGRLLAPALGGPLGSALVRALAPRCKALHHYLLRRMYGDPRRISPGTLEGYAAAVAIPGTLDHVLGILRYWVQDLAEVEALLPRIAALPTLVLWGTRDRVVLPDSAEPLRQRFQHAELEMMDGVGHLPYEEVPERFNRVVIEFLNRG